MLPGARSLTGIQPSLRRLVGSTWVAIAAASGIAAPIAAPRNRRLFICGLHLSKEPPKNSRTRRERLGLFPQLSRFDADMGGGIARVSRAARRPLRARPSPRRRAAGRRRAAPGHDK